MNKLKTLSLLVITYLFGSQVVYAKDLSMCMDPRFATRAELSGFKKLMFDAAQRSGYTITISPVLWDQCQEDVQSGKYIGAIPASYNDERNGYMYYPSDATTNLNSTWAVAKLDYVVVTPISMKYKYDGNPQSIPQPAMVPTGHEVLVARLLKLNPSLKVLDTEANDKRNLARLVRGDKGSVIMIKDYAEVLMQRSMYKERLQFDAKPVFTVTYFMPFARKQTEISVQDIQKIWGNIALLKKDPKWLKANMPQDDE